MGSAAILTWQQGLGCFPGSQISTLGNGPKSLPERAENVPFATHSEDLFGFKEVGVLFVAQLLQYMVSQTLATDALDLQRV